MAYEGLDYLDTHVWGGWEPTSNLHQELQARRERLAPLGRLAKYVYECGRCYRDVWYDWDDTGLQYLAGTKTPCRCYHQPPAPESKPPPKEVRFEDTPFWKKV